MKRVLSILFITAFSIVCLGQNSTHLKFKGIPLDGNYKVFAQKLIQKDFRQIEATNDGIVLIGNFMATPEVMVLVYPDPTSKAVSTVSAMIETGDNWPTIEGKYNDVVATYKEKYGEPTEHFEEFSTVVNTSDFLKKEALHDGQCNYRSIWALEGGHIVISLVYFQFKNYVVCSYADEQNVKALHQTIIDDI